MPDLTLLSAWRSQGCLRSRNDLITRHLPLIRRLAKKQRPSHVEVDDLVSVGAIGFIEAIDRFDESRDVKLATFARYWILRRMREHMANTAGAVRVASTRTLYCEHKKNGAEAVRAKRQDPWLGEALAKAVSGQNTVSMDAPNEQGSTLHDLLSTDAGTDDLAEHSINLDRIRDELDMLQDQREHLAFWRYHVEEQEWDEVGAGLGVSAGRAQQLAELAEGWLRERLTA